MVKCLQILAIAMSAGALYGGSDAAAGYFAAGQRAQKAGDLLKAYLLYARAARLDPENRAYAARRSAFQNAPSLNPSAKLGPDPADETLAAALGAAGLETGAAPLAAPPPRLVGAPGLHSFDLRGEARMIFDRVAGAYGIQVLFDYAYQAPPPFTFRISGASYTEALRALEAASDSFLIPVGERLALAARDTAQKRTELMPVMSLVAPIPERISVQEAQEIATAVQQTMEIRRITMDPLRRAVIFRDAVPKVLAARQMFANLSRLRAQIEVEIELLSVSQTSTLSYGLSLPTAASIVDFGTAYLNRVTTAALTPGQSYFALAGGGGTLLGLGIANAAAFATVSKSAADSVLRSQVVALDGQAATFKVGNRFPITTASFSGGTGVLGLQNGGFAPVVQYEDLGLALKVTPVVHGDSEVTLEVDAQFRTLGNGSFDGIPVIDNRQYQGKVRLKSGEWAVIAGLVFASDSETPSGIAGLGNIPWVGRLFSHQVHTRESSQALIVLKPRLVALPPWDDATKPLWTGTESRPITPF